VPLRARSVQPRRAARSHCGWVLTAAAPAPPPCAEFLKTAAATLVGFGIMGFIGFFVKLIHIPINNIIVG
jgi:protein translocase SEC61 complex gamma subunit